MMEEEDEIPEWLEITKTTWFYTVDNLIALYWEFVAMERAAGREVDEAGVLNMNVVESAVDKMRYGDYFAPGSLLDSIAFLIETIVLYHAFGNVNKRFASYASLVFLENNNISATMTLDVEKELFCMLIGVAQGQVDRCEIHDFFARIVRKKRKPASKKV